MDSAPAAGDHPAGCQALAWARAYLPEGPGAAAVLGTLVRHSPGSLPGHLRGHLAADSATPWAGPVAPGRTHLPALPAGLLIWVQADHAPALARCAPGGLQPGESFLAPGLYLSGPRERPQTLVHAPGADLTLAILRPEAWAGPLAAGWSAMRERIVALDPPEKPTRGLTSLPAMHGLDGTLRGRARAQAVEAMLLAAHTGAWAQAHADTDTHARAYPSAPVPGREGPSPPGRSAGLAGWWQALDAQLVRRPVGQRQRERLARAWTGLAPSRLRAHARAEAALLHAAALLRSGQLDWRQVALLAGYTDQPHLCRETRRLSGFSPVQLMRGMLGEDPFWIYRAWALARLERLQGRPGPVGMPLPGQAPASAVAPA